MESVPIGRRHPHGGRFGVGLRAWRLENGDRVPHVRYCQCIAGVGEGMTKREKVRISDKYLRGVENLMDLPIVLVEWVDATSVKDNGWRSVRSAREKDPVRILTTGFLVRNGACLHVLESIGDHGMVGDVTLVPSKWIKQLFVLKPDTRFTRKDQ